MDKQKLKKWGFKATSPRLKILTLLQSTHHKHWSAEAIFQELLAQNNDVSLATIYRVLTQFYEAGVLIRHQFANGNFVFELAQGKHHDHLICLRCESIEEFLDETIETCQQRIAKQDGFQMSDHSLVIYELCCRCL